MDAGQIIQTYRQKITPPGGTAPAVIPEAERRAARELAALGPDAEALLSVLDDWHGFLAFIGQSAEAPPLSLALLATHARLALEYGPVKKLIADRKVKEADAALAKAKANRTALG